MSKNPHPKNRYASIKARLLDIARERGVDYNTLTRLYFQERFLDRLSKSRYSENLYLKGALLFMAYEMTPGRLTQDIDFLANDIKNESSELRKIFTEILSIDIDDCVSFNSTDIKIDPIIAGGVQNGVRIFFRCSLDNIKGRLQIDLGFGDVILKDPVKLQFPVILKEFDKPDVLAYRIETALAEKFEAIVTLHLLNSRMKDFYDIIFIASNFKLTLGSISESINATFVKRGTKLENSRRIFEARFKRNPEMQTQWNAFLSRKKLQFEINFEVVVTQIESFLKPCIDEPESDAVWNPEAFMWEKL